MTDIDIREACAAIVDSKADQIENRRHLAPGEANYTLFDQIILLRELAAQIRASGITAPAATEAHHTPSWLT